MSCTYPPGEDSATPAWHNVRPKSCRAPGVRVQSTLACLVALALLLAVALAHGVTEGDNGYIQEITGVHFIPFIYLGAKHMVTGYDHLLFLPA